MKEIYNIENLTIKEQIGLDISQKEFDLLEITLGFLIDELQDIKTIIKMKL